MLRIPNNNSLIDRNIGGTLDQFTSQNNFLRVGVPWPKNRFNSLKSLTVGIIDREPVELDELRGNLQPGIPNSFTFSQNLTPREIQRLREAKQAEEGEQGQSE